MARLVVAVHGHPEAYPPTLNALEQLAPDFERVSVLYRPFQASCWRYPPNVELIASGPVISASEQQVLPVWQRYQLVLRFARDLRRALVKEEPGVVLLYDPITLLAYWLISSTLPKRPIVWYHNHDVIDPSMLRRFSLAWLAKRAEHHMFPHLDLFSLPAGERAARFPMHRLTGRYFFLPNLPSQRFFGRYVRQGCSEGALRLIFQGHVAEGHGLEELMSLMPLTIKGRAVHLTMVGRFEEGFRRRAEVTVRERGLHQYVRMLDFTPYRDLPPLTATCDVGIAIYAGDNIMSRTVGTASNKIYEYAALGLPVLFYDNPHFREHLADYLWAVPTNLSDASLKQALERIVENYAPMSAAARSEFCARLNFERHFAPVRQLLQDKLGLSPSPVSMPVS